MPNLILNFAADSDRPDFSQPVPIGIYNVTIDTSKSELKQSKVKKTPFVNIAFRVNDGDFKDRIVFDDVYLSQAAMFRVRKLLKAAGVDTPDVGEMTFNTDLIHNRNIRIKVKHEPKDSGDGVWVRVDDYLPKENGGAEASGFKF